MADSDITIASTGLPSTGFNPRNVDRGGGVREPVHSLAKVDGTQINPATAEGIEALRLLLATPVLPTGAATVAAQNTIAANQNSTAAGTSATSAQAVQGVTGGVPLPVSGSVAATNAGTFPVQNTAATPAGTNVIGSTTLRSAGTNRSASVTTTASTLMAANTARQGWKIKNDSAVGIWINFDATATAAAGSGNILIPAGGYLSSEPGFVETGAMSAIAVSGSAAITAREH